MPDFVSNIIGTKNIQSHINRISNGLEKEITRNMKVQALALKALIQKGIISGAPGGTPFLPLAESTILMKGGKSKPLINKGNLVGSISVDIVGDNEFFVGVNRSKKTKDGKELFNIAEVHEEGTEPFEIEITSKMRMFFGYMHSAGIIDYRLKKTTNIIKHPGVPKRSFIAPSFELWKKTAMDNFERDMENFMRKRT